jgi:hypothetical protein
VEAAARVQGVLVEAPESRMLGLSRESPILSAGPTSAGLAGLAGAGVGAEVGVGVPRRSVQRQLERGWRMQAQTTVTRTMDPATLGHMRTMDHMHMRRRHMEQITGQLCRHLHRMDRMQMEHLDPLE